MKKSLVRMMVLALVMGGLFGLLGGGPAGATVKCKDGPLGTHYCVGIDSSSPGGAASITTRSGDGVLVQANYFGQTGVVVLLLKCSPGPLGTYYCVGIDSASPGGGASIATSGGAGVLVFANYPFGSYSKLTGVYVLEENGKVTAALLGCDGGEYGLIVAVRSSSNPQLGKGTGLPC